VCVKCKVFFGFVVVDDELSLLTLAGTVGSCSKVCIGIGSTWGFVDGSFFFKADRVVIGMLRFVYGCFRAAITIYGTRGRAITVVEISDLAKSRGDYVGGTIIKSNQGGGRRRRFHREHRVYIHREHRVYILVDDVSRVAG
jgi:hypothetical protein